MKIKSKIILFVCAFALIFSVLSVSCFASSLFSPGDSFTFVESPVISFPDGGLVSFDLTGNILLGYTYDSGSYYVFDSFVVSSDEIYITADDDYHNISYSGGFWEFNYGEDSSNPISPPSFVVLLWGDYSPSVVEWFSSNTVSSSSSSNSFYSNLYSSISDGVFGPGAVLSSEQVMTLTLISTILSYAFILLPLLLVIGFVLRCFRL